MTRLYEIHVSQRDRDGIPRMVTDLITKSKRRIYDRTQELTNGRPRRLCRVVDFYGHILSDKEIHDMR